MESNWKLEGFHLESRKWKLARVSSLAVWEMVSALKTMTPELVARLLTQIFVTSDPPAAIYSTLPPRVAAAYASADKFVSSVRNQVSKNGMDVRAGNELDAARRLLANIGVGPRRVAGMVAGGCHDASPPPPPSADGALIRVVKASPDVNPYNQILSYCPHGTEDRYLGPNPVTTPEFRRMRDPENSAFDIIELRIRVLSQASVSDIRKMCVGVKRVGEELEEDGRRVGRGPRVSVDRDDVASIGTLSGGNLQILADQATSTAAERAAHRARGGPDGRLCALRASDAREGAVGDCCRQVGARGEVLRGGDS